MLWQQQYHLLFIQRLSSIGYGNGNKANFSYKFTMLVFHMLWQRRNNSLFVHFEDPVHDGDVPALHLEHYNLPHTDGLLPVVGQKQQVPPVEGWLHATTATLRQTWLSLLKGHGFKSLQEWQENFIL